MKSRLAIAILVACVGAFVFGLVTLFKLRFEVGDVYPPYSSLRSDPLGTMAFYESLGRMPGVVARRDFTAANQLPDGRGVVYLHLAASRWDWSALPEGLIQEIDRFLAQGGRLVIAFLPETSRPFLPLPPPTGPPGKPGKSPSAKPGKSPSAKPDRRGGKPALERWGVGLGYEALEQTAEQDYIPARVINRSAEALPPELDWHSGMVFTNLTPDWRTIYARGTNAVLIERRAHSGSVVMATDSFFLSNEALAVDRHADVLAWLVGRGREVVFDEAHLGVVEDPGLATLIRKYRLHGLMAGLLLLAGLFIWKNAASFLPPAPEDREPEAVAGKEAAAGLVNLLRRNLGSREVLRTCFDMWTRSLGKGSGHSIKRVDRAQAVLEAESARARVEQDPVRAYREICRVLKEPGG